MSGARTVVAFETMRQRILVCVRYKTSIKAVQCCEVLAENLAPVVSTTVAPKMLHLFYITLVLFFSFVACQTENTKERLTQSFAFVAYPKIFDGIIASRLETPLQFRALLYVNMVTFNAWSNFHPTAVDIFGRKRFKLPSRFHTTENKNIAILFGLLRLYESSPQSFGGDSALPAFRQLMRERGLDPDDQSTNTSTVVGVGNREGKDLGRLLAIDGWNSQGDLTATAEAFKLPFQDYTGYQPINPPCCLKHPFRWQALLETNNIGFFFRQEHVTPYAGSAIAFSVTPAEVATRKVRSPYRFPRAQASKALKRDLKTLRRNARGVLKISRRLTVRKRLLAELMDNKVNGFKTEENPLGEASIAAALRFFILGPELDFTLDEEIIYGLAANIVTFDAMVTVWKEKLRHDLVRPTGQTMEFLFGDSNVKVSGGAGKGTVSIKAREWQPYIRTMPHSEYPSASACACSAIVEHALLVTKGRDVFPYNVTFSKGSSRFAKNFPERDVTIGINRLSEWSRLCGKSRLWAGVHFEPAVDAGVRLCKGLGNAAENTVQNLVRGRADLKFLKWLPADTERFWEH